MFHLSGLRGCIDRGIMPYIHTIQSPFYVVLWLYDYAHIMYRPIYFLWFYKILFIDLTTSLF